MKLLGNIKKLGFSFQIFAVFTKYMYEPYQTPMQIHKISGPTAVLLRKITDYKTILDDVNGNSETVSTYTLVSVLKSIFLQTAEFSG